MNDQEKEEFLRFCEGLTDNELATVYWDEYERVKRFSGTIDKYQYYRDCYEIAFAERKKREGK